MKECIDKSTVAFYDGIIMRHQNAVLERNGEYFDPVVASAIWRKKAIFDIGRSYSRPDSDVQHAGNIILFRAPNDIQHVTTWDMCVGALTQMPEFTTGGIK